MVGPWRKRGLTVGMRQQLPFLNFKIFNLKKKQDVLTWRTILKGAKRYMMKEADLVLYIV